MIICPSQIKHFKKELVVCGLEIGDRARDGSKKVNSQDASKKSLGPLYLLISCNHKLEVQQVETCSGHQIVRRSGHITKAVQCVQCPVNIPGGGGGGRGSSCQNVFREVQGHTLARKF